MDEYFQKDTPLNVTVDQFNERAKKDEVGRTQPLLTVDEVVANIRGWDRQKNPISDQTYEVFRKIAETRMMPKGSSLQFITKLYPNKGYDYTVWWVDLTVNQHLWKESDKYLAYISGGNLRIRDRILDSVPAKSEIEPKRHPEEELLWRKMDEIIKAASARGSEKTGLGKMTREEYEEYDRLFRKAIILEDTTCSNPKRMTGEPFPVKPAKDFFGRVVDESGKPLEGVLIDAWTWLPGDDTKSDKNGNFRLSNLEQNKRIEVRFSKEGFSPVHITQQPVGELTQPVVLNSKTYFEGTIKNPSGHLAPNTTIRAFTGPKDGDGVVLTVNYETKSDKNGRYRLYVHPDTYDVKVRSPDGFVARLQETKIDRNVSRTLDLTLEKGLAFRSKVKDSVTGQPVKGVRLYNWENPGFEAASDENGKADIPGMQPGEFEFDVEAEKIGYRRWWSPQALNKWEQYDIEKSGWQRNFDHLIFMMVKDMPLVEIIMEKGVSISGRVIDPDGKPVDGATVAPALTGTGNSLTGDTRFSVKTGKDGSFEMLLPASGKVEYNLVAHDGDYDEWRKWANGVLPPIKTKPGEIIKDVTLKLTKPCMVKGQVLTESGKPVADRDVRAEPTRKDENRYYDPTVRTKADGTFELKFVRPGQHFIQAAPFWLAADEAPKASSMIVEAKASEPVEKIKLVVEQ